MTDQAHKRWARPRRQAPKTFEELRERMLAHAKQLRRRAFDELAEDLEDEVNGDDPEADRDVYGRELVEPLRIVFKRFEPRTDVVELSEDEEK